MSAATLLLRAFTASDDEALISWVRSPEELVTFAGPDLSWPLDRGQLAAIRRRRETTAWTAIVPPSDDPVGHIELGLVGQPRRGHIARVIVDPARRREGLGTGLVEAALQEAMRHGLSLVTLNVRKHNYAAIGIYSALGFREVGGPRRDREVLRMALRLDSAD